MKIKRNKKPAFIPDLIITADWHLMEKNRTPPCRTDDYWKTQWQKLEEIANLQKKYNCYILLAGDIFEHWKTSPLLINTFYRIFPPTSNLILSCAGNHDLPQHNEKLIAKSGYSTLELSSCLETRFYQGNYGRNLENYKNPFYYWLDAEEKKGLKIRMIHAMVWKGKRPWPDCVDPNVDAFMDKFPDTDLIITGHNHQTFTHRKGNRLLINPGSLTRHKADQIDHKPCVFLWRASDNTFKKHYLKIDKKAVSREHIEDKKEKDKRSLAFITSLKKKRKLSFSFEKNIERRLKENKIPEKVSEYVYKWLD